MQDILVIGGGINGAGIARDAAGRGLRVTLCEQADLASGTSSASTKLIHGGLRYLEYGDFTLVREALVEREILLRMAPHIIWPLRFILPHSPGMRPAWLLRIGLAIYDHLGHREFLPGSRRLDLRSHRAGEPISRGLKVAFEYSDCWADDSRLVVLNAVDAAERGATVLTRTRVTGLRRAREYWDVDTSGPGGDRTLRTRAIVNAAGPWVASVGALAGASLPSRPVRLVKGSHLVTKRLHDGDQAYIFQGADSRIAFAIPYEREFTLVGTTEVTHGSMNDRPEISPDELAYLLKFINRYFRKPIAKSDIVSTFAGVRPLLDEAGKRSSAVSREYVLDLDAGKDGAPAMTIYGGKLTTYRTLAEKSVSMLQDALDTGTQPWTARSHLPGGDIRDADFAQFEADMRRRYAWLDSGILQRLLRSYGTRIEPMLGSASRPADLGRHFGHGLYEAEVDYLYQREFATAADDILWRRSKLGLKFEDRGRAALASWMGGDTATRQAGSSG